MEEKEAPSMHVAIRYIADAVTVGLCFWLIFVGLIVWIALVRAIEWLADANTENLARLSVWVGSLANAAWSHSHLRERLAAFRTDTEHTDPRPGLPAGRLNAAHLVHHFHGRA